MEYSIHELSKISGVTPRTLRWYDHIGLLKPLRTGENGYRYYGEAEIKRLQDILYFRAMNIELARIKDCLDDPAFDRIGVLRGHLTELERERTRIERLIASVKDTISAEERNEFMNDEKKFEAFKHRAIEENEKRYGKELREKYGDAEIDEANARAMKITAGQYREWKDLEKQILEGLESAVQNGVSCENEEGKKIVELHKRWLTLSGSKYSPELHRGLAQMFELDERFKAYYDRNIPGCAEFLRDAVIHWAK